MNKPPKSTPHSDIDGVHREERRNSEVAAEQGQSAADLKRAADHSAGRPNHSKEESRDDRSK